MKTELPNVSKNEPQNFGSLSTCIILLCFKAFRLAYLSFMYTTSS